MYATIRIYDSADGFADAVGEHGDEVLRLLREIDGFHGYHMVRGDDGTAVSVSVYQDRAGAEASNAAAAEWVRANLPEMRLGAPRIVGGDVTVDG